MYYVTMTDTFLSGWGKAEGKTHKQIVECETLAQAEEVQDLCGRKSQGFRRVNISCNVPKYPASRYTYTWREYDPNNTLTHMGLPVESKSRH